MYLIQEKQTRNEITRQADDHNSDSDASIPEPLDKLSINYLGEMNVTTCASRTNSIKIVLQRDSPDEDYNIREVSLPSLSVRTTYTSCVCASVSDPLNFSTDPDPT